MRGSPRARLYMTTRRGSSRDVKINRRISLRGKLRVLIPFQRFHFPGDRQYQRIPPVSQREAFDQQSTNVVPPSREKFSIKNSPSISQDSCASTDVQIPGELRFAGGNVEFPGEQVLADPTYSSSRLADSISAERKTRKNRENTRGTAFCLGHWSNQFSLRAPKKGD